MKRLFYTKSLILLTCVILCTLSVTAYSQLTADPANNTNTLDNTPIEPTDNLGVGNVDRDDNLNTDGGLFERDPGGPIDPPDDIIPLDGGVSLLLAVGIAGGFRRKRNGYIQNSKKVS